MTRPFLRQPDPRPFSRPTAPAVAFKASARTPMINLRTILFVVGLVQCLIAATMVLPAMIDLVADEGEWVALLVSALITAFFGITTCLATWSRVEFSLSLRDAFVLTSMTWLVTSGFASLPFMLSHSTNLGIVDALFETVSGLTTTGSTVLSGLDKLPHGILFWRSFIQGLGGAGIIILAIVVLPFLRIGGMQLFRTESSDRSEKIVPSSFQLVRYIAFAYIGLILACALAYKIAGMTWFDAVNHAMTTLSTAGYSTHDASFGFFKSPAIHWVAILFMIAGALPLVIYVRMVRGETLALLNDRQVRAFVGFVALASLAMAVWIANSQDRSFFDALTLTAFNVVSISTTTGYASADYMQWGAPAVGAFMIFTLLGGCTGSTAGGIKIFRYQMMFLMIRTHVIGLVSPRRVFVPTYAGRQIEPGIVISVLAFVSAYVLALFIFSLGLTVTGLDFLTSISSVTQAMGNVGPGLGDIVGPAGNFASLSDPAKLMLIAAMLLGRLEFFTLLVLLSRDFWR